METSSARSAAKVAARPRLVTSPSLTSLEQDTSALDESWVYEEQQQAPRDSYIALKPRQPLAGPPEPQPATPLAHDVWESGHALLVLVELPGVCPDHVGLSLGSHSLFLTVTQPPDVEHFGIAPGSYELVIEAPDGLGPDAIDASMSHGVLRVRVSKAQAGERHLPIASSEEE
jgi:HSP20 family molecular chaperone IbpA